MLEPSVHFSSNVDFKPDPDFERDLLQCDHNLDVGKKENK